MRVLVIEDEPKVANAMREGLEEEGYQVVTTASGEDGFFRLSTEQFDLVLIDLGMPGRDVWKETARSITLDNVIDVQIARLRRKIDSDHPVKLIHTIRGIGFMLSEQEP